MPSLVTLPSSNFDALFSGRLEYRSNSVPIDRLDRLGRYAECDPPLLFRNIESFLLQVYGERPLRFVVRMRHVVTRYWTFSGQLIFT